MVDRIDWDGKEFLCTGISVKIDNEKGIILTEIEGEASTWGPDGVAGPYPPGTPLPPPDDNPPEYWPVWPPPVGLPPNGEGGGDPPPWAEEDELYFPITAYIALNLGHVIRGTNLGPGWGTICEYHNCGQVDANGLNWMALDEFDPENTAMVLGPYRAYKTTNLSDDNPTWTQVFPTDGTAWPLGELWKVRSSPVQRNLWMILGMTGTSIYVWWSLNGGSTWAMRNFTSGDADGAAPPDLELSTHDANYAWAVWTDNGALERTYIAATDDMWATAPTQTFIPLTCFDGGPFGSVVHHREYDNDDDSVRIYGGVHTTGADDYARVYYSGNCTTLYTDVGGAQWVWFHRIGCGIGTENRWWAVASDGDVTGLWISDDGISWTEQKQWDLNPSGTRWWIRDCKNLRGNWQWYILTRDGDALLYPLTITVNRGETWAYQWGNWNALMSDEGWGANLDVVTVCPVEAART